MKRTLTTDDWLRHDADLLRLTLNILSQNETGATTLSCSFDEIESVYQSPDVTNSTNRLFYEWEQMVLTVDCSDGGAKGYYMEDIPVFSCLCADPLTHTIRLTLNEKIDEMSVMAMRFQLLSWERSADTENKEENQT